MPRLIVKRKAEVLQEFLLRSDQVAFTIGTEEHNDLVLDDKLVSEQHLRIERQMNRYYVRDLNSAFGTFVNGEKVETMLELKHGDLIRVGGLDVVFDAPLENGTQPEAMSEAAFTASPFESETEASAVSTAGEPVQVLHETASQTQAEHRSELAPYYLIAIYGPYRGKRFQLRYGDTRIGRDENLNDIVINRTRKGEADQSISRRHATVTFKNNGFFISDKRSKTRTLVNQLAVPVDEEVQLYPGDEIEIVSDRQSTIFRFVEEHHLDYSPPKKAGVWWVRYRTRFVAVAALALLAGGLYLAAQGFTERSMLTQRPNPLSFEFSDWATDRSMLTQSAFDSENGLFGLVPAAADFNGDGYVDLATTNVTGKPLLIDGQTRLPTWIVDTQPVNPNTAFASSDVNHDGYPDLVYLSQDGRLVAVDGNNGAEIWTSPFFQAGVTAPAVLADFDGDGLTDVAVADELGRVHVGMNRVLSMEWSAIETEVPIRAVLTSADLDGDGDAELVSGSERGLLLLLDPVAQSILASLDVNQELNQALGTFYEDNQIRFPVGVTDLTGDGQPDFVAATLQGRILALDGASKRRLWHESFEAGPEPGESYRMPFVLGDVTGDGVADVLLCTADGEVRAYDGRGRNRQAQLLWRHPVENAARVLESFAVGDLGKDGAADLVFLDSAGMLNVLDGRDGSVILRTQQPVRGRMSLPLMADLDADGYLDVFLYSEHGMVLQYRSNSQVPKSFVLWGQQFGDSANLLQQAARLPATARADVSMAVGLFLALGGVGTLVMTRRKSRNP